MIVAIDGPAGSGKSTVARALAAKLGFAYLDSGAMYRCVALAAIERYGPTGVQEQLAPPYDGAVVSELAAGLRIELDGGVKLDGREVAQQIRSIEVSEAASAVAAVPGVRSALVAMQRALVAEGDWVVEGRDIGTVVAPDAQLKVFLTANPAERARRRAAELGADARTVLAEQAIRDARDTEREHSPLAAAQDAVLIDTTGRSIEQVVAQIAQLARERS
ncbi:MAG TPA: (d)CMP kinase [Solirubrobacteraceae bacterium]|jgi:cytidylate kinase|nr:(d)CMP kinase [Solirubrobacteraceae bacterium]